MSDAIPAQNRVTVSLIPKAQEAAETAMRLTGLNKTDVINRALQAYAFLVQVAEDGSEVLVRSKGGEVEQVKFL